MMNQELKIKNSKKKIILSIDTSSNKEIIVSLEINNKKYITKQKIGLQKAQVVLPMIDKLLKNHGLKINSFNKIEVNTGPGSFTGLRVGIAIANAFSFALGIPINNKKKREFVHPQYG
ncbi:MAG: tRNA (adenosine(37)-N6)-threonylcarbamoyltransferase complex dimerization subunit type 1 TsaB [Candidatus Levyibacteriota bacterium]